MSFIFNILAIFCSIYSILCLIAIIITFIPGAKFTSLGKFLSSMTDPYLNFFKRFKKLIIENIDFSPILAIGVLSLLSSIFSKVSSLSKIYFGGILEAIISMIWNLIFYILLFFGILSFIRWISLQIGKNNNSYNSPWISIDNVLTRISYKFTKKLTKKTVNYKTSLLITVISCAVLSIAGYFLFGIIAYYCVKIPF